MQIAITGSTGMIGRALVTSLVADGHRVRPLVRSAGDAADDPDAIYWSPADGTLAARHLEGVDAVVHLAGAGIGDRRWTEDRKKVIRRSRVDGTDLLARALASLDRPPEVLISGSAVGYYGDGGDEILTEERGPGEGFVAEVATVWEEAAAPAREAGIRVVHIRSGVVLDAGDGLLKRLIFPFRLGLGGRIGPGTQWMSWISREDEVRAIRFLIDEDISGPVNVTAPEPVTNSEFTAALGRALHRPAVIPTPVPAVSLVMGRQMVEETVLISQRARPLVLEEAGFEFRHPTIDEAMAAALGSREGTE